MTEFCLIGYLLGEFAASVLQPRGAETNEGLVCIVKNSRHNCSEKELSGDLVTLWEKTRGFLFISSYTKKGLHCGIPCECNSVHLLVFKIILIFYKEN